jgi:predicted Fe-Mo cluster-binding NifX family protein
MNRLQIAILGVGLLLAPWLMLAATRPSKPLPTLVGVPAEDRDLSAPVAELFGKAPYFMVADLRTSTAKAVKNPYWRDRGAMGLKSAYLLLDEGVGAILVKSIRPAIHNAFYSRGVHVYDGNADTVYEAVQRFQNGAAADLGPPRLPHHMDPTPT